VCNNPRHTCIVLKVSFPTVFPRSYWQDRLDSRPQFLSPMWFPSCCEPAVESCQCQSPPPLRAPTASDGKKTDTPITPIQPQSGDSTPLGVNYAVVTRGRNESSPPTRAPTRVLWWGELGTFFIISKRIGDSLSRRLAMCGASNGFGSCEVHGEIGVEDERPPPPRAPEQVPVLIYDTYACRILCASTIWGG